jgi:glycogen debranching enzyme
MSPQAERGSTALGEEITVHEGSSFCRSDRAGDISAHRAQGMFVKDTRLISTWELVLDDQPLEPLAVLGDQAFATTFLCRAAPRRAGGEATVVVERRRLIAADLREDITVRNFGPEPLGATLTLLADADFADLFSVKDGHRRTLGTIRRQVSDDGLKMSVSYGDQRRGVCIVAHGAAVTRTGMVWRLAVPAHGFWRSTVQVLPSAGGEPSISSFPLGWPLEAAIPARRMRDWHASTPRLVCENPELQQAVERSVADLGALRISDPKWPELDVVAAGAPWFMALFGRDSLLTSTMILPWDLGLARGTLHTLARLQGNRVEALSEEEPGKILHEVRLGIDESLALGGSSVYYGTVDATPLFVVLLDQAVRWGLSGDDLAQLLPAADRAMSWIETYGDADGDGFVEYQRKTDRGLVNQGWKDSHDAISYRDGRLGYGPIALCEVQAYVYGAYRARGHLAALVGDAETARRCEEKAARLKQRFNEAFWLPEYGYYALALDGDKRPVDALASNQGHCLWAGIATPDHAGAVADRLLSGELFTGWGIRTLAGGMGTFSPISYHNGSVWPHDNALAVAGLARYGHLDAAAKVATALVEAAAAFGGRLPELFCGFDRGQVPFPVTYPASCSPQAWAAATPIALVAALLQLTPDLDHGTVDATNALPPQWGRLLISGLAVGDKQVNIDSADLPRA